MSSFIITDQSIKERHELLVATIDPLDMEIESFQLSGYFSWIFCPIFMVLTFLQVSFFYLYNEYFHPSSKIVSQDGT